MATFKSLVVFVSKEKPSFLCVFVFKFKELLFCQRVSKDVSHYVIYVGGEEIENEQRGNAAYASHKGVEY